jgi:hypothetical protein
MQGNRWAAGLVLILLGATATLAACGTTSTSVAQVTPSVQASPSPIPSPSPSPIPSPSPVTCTASGPASDWTVPTANTPSILSATVSGDILTFTFTQGTPAFQVTPESSSTFFVGDGKGDNVTVAGSAGAIIVLQGFRGDILNYGGPNDMTSNGPILLEVRHVNEFEGFVHWAVGLQQAGCANVTASGSTLVFHFVAS